jgi:acetyltransferase-like isoleucine patch superfamily enzyme
MTKKLHNSKKIIVALLACGLAFGLPTRTFAATPARNDSSGVVIAGGTVVQQNCYIGSRSSLINGITVGEFSLVGMGSNVVCSVESNSVIVGNPAKPLVKK